jgi:hypothetical protein
MMWDHVHLQQGESIAPQGCDWFEIVIIRVKIVPFQEYLFSSRNSAAKGREKQENKYRSTYLYSNMRSMAQVPPNTDRVIRYITFLPSIQTIQRVHIWSSGVPQAHRSHQDHRLIMSQSPSKTDWSNLFLFDFLFFYSSFNKSFFSIHWFVMRIWLTSEYIMLFYTNHYSQWWLNYRFSLSLQYDKSNILSHYVKSICF